MKFNNYLYKTGDYVCFRYGNNLYYGIVNYVIKTKENNFYDIQFRIILEAGWSYAGNNYTNRYFRFDISNKSYISHLNKEDKKEIDRQISEKLKLKYDVKNNFFRRV